MPVICSRMTRFTLSSEVCISRNCGIIRGMTRPTTTPSTGTATAMSQDSATSSRNAMKMPPTMMIGVETMIGSAMKTTICTWVTSLVLREISVGAPNATPPARRSRRRGGRSPNAGRGRGRPRSWAPIRVAPIVAMICTNDTADLR